MKTDDFEYGMKVKVNDSDHFMNGMIGTVIDRDAYTVEVRFEEITEEMKDYEDTRTGIANFYPKHLIKM